MPRLYLGRLSAYRREEGRMPETSLVALVRYVFRSCALIFSSRTVFPKKPSTRGAARLNSADELLFFIPAWPPILSASTSDLSFRK
ncbi:hypothetical protein FQZ97_867050 [compost metagenome]